MKIDPKEIFIEYTNAEKFKNSLGEKGIKEQSVINNRFYNGDQWHGSGAGTDRPLVRHNVIKRIGDFKMSHIMSGIKNIKYTADGISSLVNERTKINEFKSKIMGDRESLFTQNLTTAEMNFVTDALTEHRNRCSERLCLDMVCAKALKQAYISGTGIVYTYWDKNANSGEGDIGCEVISVNNVFFGDPYTKEVEDQPYIIISGYYDVDSVCREAEHYGADNTAISKIKDDSDSGKVLVLTKFTKIYMDDGSYAVFCTKVTENVTVRPLFNTTLKMYPIAVFGFEERDDIIYGDSEITYLIPNQIAINRMITANVWASMSSGMPIMVVNGDSVTGDITNDPGQIIKVYGSNEDVKGAIGFVSPPDFSRDFSENINNLIGNTLTQSGASSAVLGDELLDNATVMSSIKENALISLNVLKSRYNNFIKQISLIWVEFFICCYKERNIKITDENGIWYFLFKGDRYKGLTFLSEICEDNEEKLSLKEKTNMLISLFEKGIINRNELLKRIPDSYLSDPKELIYENNETEVEI